MVYMSANSERVKRWRDKHRALHNLRRRNARKKNLRFVKKEAERETTVPRIEMTIGVENNLSVPDEAESGRQSPSLKSGEAREGNSPNKAACPNQQDFRGGQNYTISQLRELIEKESMKPPETTVDAPPTVYRNDYGGVISKFQWEKLQRLKEKAKSGGYEMDEYSQ